MYRFSIPFTLLAALTLSAQQPASSLPQADSASTAPAQVAPDPRMAKAEDLLEHGDYKAAEPELKQLAQDHPHDASVQFDLGFIEEHNGEDQSALIAYTASVAADPTLPSPHLALGLLQARLGHPSEAHPQLEAVTTAPAASPQQQARALRALARLDEDNHPEQASDELLRATRLTGEQPGDADLTARLALRSGNSTDAEQAYRRTLAQSPGDLDATIGLLALLRKDGKLAEADALLAPALESHPNNPQLVAQAAALYAAEDKTTDAIALLTQLRSSAPGAAADPALTRLLAHLELLSGNTAAAEPLYRQLTLAHPDDPTLLDDLGSTLIREQHPADAQAIFTRAVGMREAFHDDQAWAETQGHLAFAAAQNHQPQVALQALAQRATVLPNSAASLFLQATSRDALHQRKQAAESYRAFLAMANGKLPDEEFEARHRLIALEHEH